MRVLIIHNETLYFAGAEKMLGYFLEGIHPAFCEVTLASVPGTRTSELAPREIERLDIPPNQKFSFAGLRRQAECIAEAHRRDPFDALHGWAARNWELTSLAAWKLKIPALGTLHDHPRAGFISMSRRWLMRASASWGLDAVACVSGAVREACLGSGYPARKLTVIHNGLPSIPEPARNVEPGAFRFGFLGAFSERKGVRTLFEMIDVFSREVPSGWTLKMAGGPQGSEGESMLAEIRRKHSGKPWWNQIEWTGWVKRPFDFLTTIDLLICPSAEFDPFPTVLLEAGWAGLPALAAKVGGIPEIIEDGETGWMFDPADPAGGADRLASLAREPAQAAEMGRRARARCEREFTIAKMVANYVRVYSTLATNA